MTVQNDIGVKMRDKLHLQLFFYCCKCGESICSTGIANDYHFPQWYVDSPIGFTDEGLVCYSCQKGAGNKGI
jgi:hypothetical protein